MQRSKLTVIFIVVGLVALAIAGYLFHFSIQVKKYETHRGYLDNGSTCKVGIPCKSGCCIDGVCVDHSQDWTCSSGINQYWEYL